MPWGRIRNGEFLSGFAKLFGNDEWAEEIIKTDWFGDWYSHPEEWFNPDKGWRFAGDVAGGIGTSLPAIGAAVGTAAAVVATVVVAAVVSSASSPAQPHRSRHKTNISANNRFIICIPFFNRSYPAFGKCITPNASYTFLKNYTSVTVFAFASASS